MSDPSPTANLSLSLDDIIKQRRTERKIEEVAKAAKKRTPIKSQENQQKSKPTSAQHATGSSKAKRDAKVAAKRGLSDNPKPSRGNVEKEIHRQQRAGSTNQPRGSPGASVYVGNLSFKTSWQTLKDHMRKAGNVEKASIMEENGKPKGCGIVIYQHPKDAQRAIRELDGCPLDGRPIFIREDRKGPKISERGAKPPELSVFVGNLSFETRWQDLKDHMRGAGNVDDAKILQHPDGRPKGCGIVAYQHPKDALRAVRQLNGSLLNRRPIIVRQDRQQAPSRPDFPGIGSHQSTGAQLYVGNLAWKTSWQDLKDLFATVGVVDRAEVIVGVDGRPKGFGIVKFFNSNNADAAIKKLDGAELDGRKLQVRSDNRA